MSYGFAYNPAGQVTSVSRDNDEFAYTGSISVNRVYAVNGLNQYMSAGPATFAYDADGNLLSDGSTSYGYDAENRLVSSSSGAALVYHPLGRLFQTSGGAAGVTRFLHDGDNLVAEYDAGGNMLRRYMFGPGGDEPILWDEGGALNCSGTKVLHGDRQGSIVAAADCWGNRVAVRAYDEYGIPSGGNVGRFQYTGQAWLPELGMYYYKARIYSPTLGRFLQTDPVGYKDQVNLYAYVGNDPINHTDPTGMCTGSNIANKDGTCASTGGFTTGSDGLAQGMQIAAARAAAATAAASQGQSNGQTARNGNTAQSAEEQQQSRYLANASLVALQRACNCKIDPKLLQPLNPNAVRVTDPSKLPSVFGRSWSYHTSGPRAQSVDIAGGYVLKFYPRDGANSGLPTVTITTPVTNPYHWIDVLAYSLGDPVNTYNARQYCLAAGGC